MTLTNWYLGANEVVKSFEGQTQFYDTSHLKDAFETPFSKDAAKVFELSPEVAEALISPSSPPTLNCEEELDVKKQVMVSVQNAMIELETSVSTQTEPEKKAFDQAMLEIYQSYKNEYDKVPLSDLFCKLDMLDKGYTSILPLKRDYPESGYQKTAIFGAQSATQNLRKLLCQRYKQEIDGKFRKDRTLVIH
jgi:hypothetical protein